MTFSSFIKTCKGLIEFSLHKVGAKRRLHEGLSLITGEVSVFVHIKLGNDSLCHSIGCVTSRSGESIVLPEIGVSVEKHLNVVMEVLPRNLSLESQIFAINSQKLWHGILLFSMSISTLVDNSDFLAAHVSVLTFVGLGSP